MCHASFPLPFRAILDSGNKTEANSLRFAPSARNYSKGKEPNALFVQVPEKPSALPPP